MRSNEQRWRYVLSIHRLFQLRRLPDNTLQRTEVSSTLYLVSRLALFALLTARATNAILLSMSASAEQLAHEALALSASERAHLAQTLLQSLEPVEEDVEQAWAVEVNRRLELVRQGLARGRPADEVFGDLRARHQG